MKERWFEAAALVLIVLLAGYFRLVNLTGNPGWYADEAVHLEIADNLLEGRIQFMAVTDSTLFFARMPIFQMSLAGAMAVFGEDIQTLRTLTALLGIGSVVLLWGVVRRLTGKPTFALLVALMLAIYPNAVLYSRIGFSYNLLTPLVLLVMLGLGEYLRTMGRWWLALAALTIGVGVLSDLMIYTMGLPFLIVVSGRRWRDGLWSVPLVGLPLLGYAIVMLVTTPDAFVFDARYTISRLGGVAFDQQIINLVENYTILISQDIWILGAVIGLFVLPSSRFSKLTALMLLSPLVLLGRIVALHGLSFYYLIPIFPLVAIGVAGLLYYGLPLLWQQVDQGMRFWKIDTRMRRNLSMFAGTLLIMFLAIGPFLFVTNMTSAFTHQRWRAQIDPFLIEADDARNVGAYLNEHKKPGDVVIVSPAIGWLIDANVVDFTMGTASIEGDNIRFWGDVVFPASRFHHDPRYTNARFVVVDNLWRTWGIVHGDGVPDMLAQVERWPCVFQSGEISVYYNLAASSSIN